MSRSTQREDHLKALYALGARQEGGSDWVSTTQMAAHLGVKPPSVTAMVQVLTELGWAEHRPYHGARLTDAGQKLALSLVRKHRLWETFLVDRLGFDWDEVHDIAEQLEHVDSVELVERLDAFLGHPTSDPHGDPIPKPDGTFHPQQETMPLSSLIPARRCVVAGVRGGDDHTLSALKLRGIGLGSVLTAPDIATLPTAWLDQLWVHPEIDLEGQQDE
ncbi:MAG: metal-dependent transcriptional regulator [Bacteroidota bacterium]|nr:metal-dependent transcriptional regulator [Bacteroidota bacterium]